MDGIDLLIIRHCVRGDLIQNYFNILNFLLAWNNNLGSNSGWPVAKSLWIPPWMITLVLAMVQHAQSLFVIHSRRLKFKEINLKQSTRVTVTSSEDLENL